MIRPICKDPLFLARLAVDGAVHLPTMEDLRDTLTAHLDACVGMAANMIGVNRRIIAIALGDTILVMADPKITRQSGAYDTDEGCLSLPGTRRVTRACVIDVTWLDEHSRPRSQTFTGFSAQIIQHEMDHLEGKLI